MACRTWEEEEEEEEEEERSQSAAPSGRCMVERAPNTACDEECGLQGEGGGGGGGGISIIIIALPGRLAVCRTVLQLIPVADSSML